MSFLQCVFFCYTLFRWAGNSRPAIFVMGENTSKIREKVIVPA